MVDVRFDYLGINSRSLVIPLKKDTTRPKPEIARTWLMEARLMTAPKTKRLPLQTASLLLFSVVCDLSLNGEFLNFTFVTTNNFHDIHSIGMVIQIK